MNDAAPGDVLALARRHLAEDPDPDHRALLAELLERAEAGDEPARADLRSRFSGPLTFGTAGLRGEIGPGTARMNRVVVLKASWGFGRYLLEEVEDAAGRGVVIAFDGRRYSRRFAEDTASVLSGLGFRVHLFDDPVPTPMCAFAVTHLKAAGGVMVTASHNPPADNGYKVYWENGAQIIPPHDEGIAASIAQAPAANELQRPAPVDAAAAGLRRAVPDAVGEAYLAGVAAGRLRPAPTSKAEGLRLVYTPMHGVGHRWTIRALREAGVEGVSVVSEQADPDGTFPTVAFPNPEEPGALDRSFALADEIGADLVVAQDPDADRLAVALRRPGEESWVRLSGNAVGVLLGADALERADTGERQKLVCTTLVSSTMLGRVAEGLGAQCEETLTGFKWIANTALRREADDGLAFVFGYEEALGYSVGPLVRDKDGVSAVVRLVELASALKAEGRTLIDRLDELYVRFGLSEDELWSVVLPGEEGKAQIAAAMEKLREHPLKTLAGEEVVRFRDLGRLVEVRGSAPGEKIAGPGSEVLTFWTEAGLRFTARPSGTEPKIKFYLDAACPVSEASELPAAREALKARLERARAEVMERLQLS